MGKFDGYLFCTDLDGTLLNNAGKISPENRQAIQWFKAEGGLFTFITGRMPFFVTDMVREVDPNTCIGCVNGGGLYDTKRQQYLWTDPVPHDVLELELCDRWYILKNGVLEPFVYDGDVAKLVERL